jgi:YbbR domain-containing protein
MRLAPRRLIEVARLARDVSRGVTLDISRHWAMAAFSVVAAFAIWAVVEDTDNPRIERPAPENGRIEVQARNVPPDRLVDALASVTVVVEGRTRDLENLRPSDFEATVDLKDATATGALGPQRVRVSSRRRGVTVVRVIPETVDVALTTVETRVVKVTARVTGDALPGFRADGPTSIDPPEVTIRGRPDLVQQVDAVDLDVNLADAREEGQFTVEGDLVARRAGNPVTVSISSAKARVTYTVEQVFVQRTFGLQPNITGSPAPGYVVTNVSSDPATVQVTGPQSIVNGLTGPLALEKLDVTGARQTITITRSIERPPNAATDRQSVVVRVEIQAIDCGSGPTAPCQAATFFVPPVLEGPLPTGLRVEGSYTVQVKISGPLAQVAALKVSDLRATISLTGAVAGQNTIVPRVTAPAGLRIDSVEPLIVTLVAASGVGP